MPVLREAFRVRLKPGALDEWVRAHDDVWPELLEVQRACGFRRMTIFALDEQDLLVVSEVEDDGSWDRLIDSEIHRRWVESLSHLSESARSDRTVARRPVREVLHLDWS